MDAKTIDTIFQDFLTAYEKKDATSIANLFVDEAVVIGTGNDEILIGKKDIKKGFQRDFEQSSQATISAEKISLFLENGFAFAAYNLHVTVFLDQGSKLQMKLRFTPIFKLTKTGWKIIQSHLSAPLQEQKDGKSFPNSL